MKKIIAMLAALTLTTALADDVSTTVTINASVANSCVFDTAATTAASFNYVAATGSSIVANGTATLYCNKGTLALLPTGAAVLTSPVTLTKTGGDTLSATVTLGTSTDTVPVTGGTYAGGDRRVYSIVPSAAADQWSASSGSYTGSTTITVTF
ncbi:hypothetical protein EHF33_14650 [Deinococcus psychrotolerans]|uniref:Spore coat protein U domain-containing protein n=1 Tax=Deinococcus psychrotolerans TaxID=2489213 RepID=A0A3G8YFS2_9DEIO|nr:hypothetical protein [Deinococcus psychrotolerans]AZI44142.1 hypothetical protein EHF33_14650 [Deinococcus psychrotolerans]